MLSENADMHVESEVLTAFLEKVQQIAADHEQPAEAVARLRPPFAKLLADATWLPDEYQRPDPEGGMGQSIGNYLIYRSAARDLTLFSLVLPPLASTPIHDHLAWGLVGLYAGEQDEWVYRRTDQGQHEGVADLREIERRHLRKGEFYDLLPPEGDIHKVQTTGPEPSVSLHLLHADVGCIWRHRYELEKHRVLQFRSGYSNDRCEEDGAAASSS